MKLRLYGKELVPSGWSRSRAVNSREGNFTPEKLRDRIICPGGRIEEYLKELEENNGKESTRKESGGNQADCRGNYQGGKSWLLILTSCFW
jgi:hypothetical protein